MPELRPYQVEAVNDILHKKKLIIADDMGLGKCAESIAAKTAIERQVERETKIEGYDARALIVCPASVTQHWEDQIKLWYKRDPDAKVKKIQTSSYEADVKDARDASFVIIGYPTLSYLGNDGYRLEQLRELDFKYGIIDEAHNAKNPDSIRSRAAKNLFDSMEYLAILTGTPIPNTIVDIYMLLSLLDKDKFPVNVENPKVILANFYGLFKRDPEFVKRVIEDRKLRRMAHVYLHERLPNLESNDLEVRLEGDHKEAYLQVYHNDDMRPALKLMELRKAALDPNLVNPNLLGDKLSRRIGELDSQVYLALDELLKRVIDSDGKALVFTDFREGVTDKLRKRYARYGAVVIDSDVSSSKQNGHLSLREETRRRFQNDLDTKVLITTTVMDEGVDLTAATDIVHLTLPYSPAVVEQRNRRSQRIGEVNKSRVNVHYIKTTLDSILPTITEGIERLLEDKRRIIKYLIDDPGRLNQEDIKELRNGGIEKSKHLIPLIRSPPESIRIHFGTLKGQGHKKIIKHYQRYPEEAEIIAKLYARHWDGYYGGNTANLYAQVIRMLEERGGLERKLDIASGPFSLSRRLKQPVTNLDINSRMLRAGRFLEEEMEIVRGNGVIQGSFHQLPIKDNSYDLVHCSLALHMSKLMPDKKEKYSEREMFFREANRILRPGGYALITLPHSVIAQNDLTKFYEGLKQLGFEVLPFSGFYRGPTDSKFRVFLAGLRKTSEPNSEALSENQLRWKMDEETRRIKGKRPRSDRRHPVNEPKDVEKEFVNEFYLITNGRTLKEIVTG